MTPNATYTVAGKAFDDLGVKLHKLDALAHLYDAAQLFDHVQVSDENQRRDFRAAVELFEIVIEQVREALGQYQAAARHP